MAIDVSRFHQTFFDEAIEGLDAMETGLLELEEGSEDNEAINTIFRAAHSIKGGAGTLGFTPMADFTHLLETILDRRRSGRSAVTQESIDVLLASVDCLRDMLAAIQHGHDLDGDRVTDVETRLRELVDRDRAAASTGDTGAEAGGDADAGPTGWRISFAPHPDIFRTGNDPVRILSELAELGHYRVEADVTSLPELEALDVEVCASRWTIELASTDGSPIQRTAIDHVFEWVEDEADILIVADEPAPTGPARTGPAPTVGLAADPPSPSAGPQPEGMTTESRNGEDRRRYSEPSGDGVRSGDRAGATRSTSMRVDIEKVDTLINMVGELVITQSMLQQLASHGDELDLEKLQEGLGELESNTRELQASVMQIRMLPISFAFSRLPRLVRDLAAKLGKRVDLVIDGETTELDKTVMEKIGDPLVHLVRNALDHGLERPEERTAAGKSGTGTVTLSAYHEGGNIVVEISDDGRGIDGERILAKARHRGLVGDDDQLSDKQVDDLIFHPGLSTADEVSDVSGRGVGMDVVKRNITDLGGVIEVVSARGRGTTFRIRLPLTLAILDGQVVRVGDQVFIIPLISIVESLQFDPALTGSVTASASVYRHRDVVIPLIDLRETLDVAIPRSDDSEPLLVVVDAAGTTAGLIVDDLMAQQQIVIKSLTTNFRAVPGLSGATILGDGTVAMILDVTSVLGLFQQAGSSPDRSH